MPCHHGQIASCNSPFGLLCFSIPRSFSRSCLVPNEVTVLTEIYTPTWLMVGAPGVEVSTLWLTRSWWRGQGLKCLLTLSTFAVNFPKCWLSLLKGLDDISLHLLGHSRKAGSLPRTSWHNFLEDWRVDSVGWPWELLKNREAGLLTGPHTYLVYI